jgi:hypothetical protein
MLHVNQLIGFGAGGGGPPTYSYTDTGEDLVGRTTYTFSAKAIGAAAGGRLVVVSLLSYQSSARTVSSVTIGGITAAIHQATVDVSGDHILTAIAYAVVPTGTTANVVVTFSGSMGACGMGVYALYDVGSTPKATGNKSTSTSFGSVSYAANDIGIYVDGGNGPDAATWTNATKNWDNEVASGASVQPATAQSITVSCSEIGDANQVYAVFGA